MPVDVDAPVIGNRRLASDYNVLALEAPAIATSARPGQFVMVKPGPGVEPLLRRPFSIFEVLRHANGAPYGISILSKRVGASTARIFDLAPGARVTCLGPLGRAFTLAEPGTEAWLVAGGVGLAPFLTLAEALAGRGVAFSLFYGGRTRHDLFYLDEFERLGATLHLSTEDGSRGEHGRVTGPLERALAATPAGRSVRVSACGPEPMLDAVARLAARYDRPCEVSVERVMGCGLGGCYSCVVPVKRDGARHFVRSCLAGPVFDAATLAWE